MSAQRGNSQDLSGMPDLDARLEEARRLRADALAGRPRTGARSRPWDEDGAALPELLDEEALPPEVLNAAQAAGTRADRIALLRAQSAEGHGEAGPGPRPLRFLSPDQKEEDVTTAEIGREADSELPARADDPLILERPLLVAPRRYPPSGRQEGRAGVWQVIRRIFGGSGVAGLALAALLLTPGQGGAGPVALPRIGIETDAALILRAQATEEAQPVEQPPAADLTETRIVVKAPDSVAETDLSLLSTVVSEAGFAEPSLERSGVTTSENHIRFYYPEDIAAAATLAGITGAEIRDFTEFDPRPEERVVELWLEGQSGQAGASGGQRTTTRKVFRPVQKLERTLDKIFGGN